MNEPKDQSHDAVITFKVSSNPLVTISNMDVEICEFLKTMIEFHEKNESEDPELQGTAASVYNMAVTIHSVIGMSMGADSPEMLRKLYLFCRDLGMDNLEDLIAQLGKRERSDS